jgi:hypothetical protein
MATFVIVTLWERCDVGGGGGSSEQVVLDEPRKDDDENMAD